MSMRDILRGCTGSFKADFLTIGTNNKKNSYFPLYVAKHYSGNEPIGPFVFDVLPNKSILYFKHKFETFFHFHRSYKELHNALLHNNHLIEFSFTNKDKNFPIKASKGYIVDSKNNILLIVCTNNIEILKAKEVQKEEIKLYISNEFLNNPLYKTIYNKVYKFYIQEFINYNTTIIYTPSIDIEKAIFSNDFKITFKTIDELNKHLKSEDISNIYKNTKEKTYIQ